MPIWEMDKVDIRTKILCCVAAFTALGRGEVEFFLKWHMSIKYLKKRLKKSFCLRGLSQAFQMLKWQLRFWRGYTPIMLDMPHKDLRGHVEFLQAVS